MLCDWVLVCSSKWSGAHYMAHAGLNLMAILLLLSSKCQDYRRELLCLVSLSSPPPAHQHIFLLQKEFELSDAVPIPHLVLGMVPWHGI